MLASKSRGERSLLMFWGLGERRCAHGLAALDRPRIFSARLERAVSNPVAASIAAPRARIFSSDDCRALPGDVAIAPSCHIVFSQNFARGISKASAASSTQ